MPNFFRSCGELNRVSGGVIQNLFVLLPQYSNHDMEKSIGNLYTIDGRVPVGKALPLSSMNNWIVGFVTLLAVILNLVLPKHMEGKKL